MSVQTSYSFDPTTRSPGRESGTTRVAKRTGNNQTGAEAAVGLAVGQSSSMDDGMVALAAQSDKVAGIVLNDYAHNPSGLLTSTGAYATSASMPVAIEGPVFVVVDQDHKPGDDVYVRYAASGNGQTGPVGSFRKDGDGVAQVLTLTPTAANGTAYRVNVHIDGKEMSFETTSDGSATATEICDAFRTAMALNSEFTSRLTTGGTATLTLTSRRQNESFVADSAGSAGTIAVALTTAASGTARRMKRARWCSSGTAAVGVGELDFDILAE